MNELQTVAAVAAGLKPTVDLAKSVLDLVGTGKGREEALKLYGQIVAAHQSALTAQHAQSTLLEEKRQLEEKLSRFENWEAEKKRYKLTRLASGTLVYSLIPEEANGEPPHSICANCYTNAIKGILQRKYVDVGRRNFLRCPACKEEIAVSGAGI
jgi:hypothetical protein